MFSVAFAPLAPAPPVQVVRVVSEKIHGSAGPFAIDLPIDGKRGVECRHGGRAGEYSMIFTFAHNLLQVGGLCCDGGSVSGAAIDPNDNHRYVVNLTGVRNASYVTVTLTGVNGSEGTYSDTVSQEMAILVGDTGGDGSVSSIDSPNARLGSPVTLPTFREDNNVDGRIDSTDVGLVLSNTGKALPSLP
jgi:hypothetical protein